MIMATIRMITKDNRDILEVNHLCFNRVCRTLSSRTAIPFKEEVLSSTLARFGGSLGCLYMAHESLYIAYKELKIEIKSGDPPEHRERKGCWSDPSIIGKDNIHPYSSVR